MPVLGVATGSIVTYLQDGWSPSVATGAVAGGIIGAFVGSIQLDDEEEVAKENVGPAELAAGAGMLAKGAYKAAVRKAIKTQTDQIAELSQQLSQQVKASGVLDEDDDDDKKRNGKARRNPVPWVRGLIVVGGTVGTLWGLKQLEWI
jgi:hypothetical protein